MMMMMIMSVSIIVILLPVSSCNFTFTSLFLTFCWAKHFGWIFFSNFFCFAMQCKLLFPIFWQLKHFQVLNWQSFLNYTPSHTYSMDLVIVFFLFSLFLVNMFVHERNVFLQFYSCPVTSWLFFDIPLLQSTRLNYGPPVLVL